MDLAPDPSNAAEQTIQDGSAQQQTSPSAANADSTSANRLRQLIARERELYDRQNQLKREAETWKSREFEFQRWQRVQELAKHDPEAAIRELGLDVEKINESRLMSPEMKMFQEMKEELASVKSQLTQREEAEKARTTTEAMQRARAEIDRVLTNGDDFELCREYEDHDLIFQTAALYTDKTGKFVSLEEAAKWVEDERTTQLERILNTKKAQAAWSKRTPTAANEAGQQAAKEAIAGAKDVSSQGQTPKSAPTLTADLSGGAQPPQAATSIAQLRARALETLKGAWPTN